MNSTDGTALAQAPDVSMTFTFSAMADSIGIVMQDAATAERNMQTLSTAAVGILCARILAVVPTP